MVDTESGRIPEGWGPKPLRAFLDLKYGKALKADNREPGPYAVFGSSGAVGEHCSALVAGPGIIVGRKGNVGAVHWSPRPFWAIDTAFYVTASLPLRWVFHRLLNVTFLNSDAAVPGLNREAALSIQVPVPPVELAGRFDALLAPIQELSDKLRVSSDRLRRSRDLLLPRLISGELTVSRTEPLLEAAE
jgi:type I restriction enzyme S subunit